MTVNTSEIPIGFNVAEAETLLARVLETHLGERIRHFSGLLLGRAYIEGSLGGGPESREELRLSLSAFDCVTFIETVLALSLARSVEHLIDLIRRVRYEGGDIEWSRRNHYMVDWATNNEEEGFVKNLTHGSHACVKNCTLNLIPGLPEKHASFNYFPTESCADVAELFQTGDVIVFVSTKENLDVFHTGFLIENEKRWLLRHATRTAGGVVDQELSEFIDRNIMAGFVLLRPTWPQ